ncbi:MAG TPA: hypothetical protein ENJ69_02025 [Bacteroidetes bacterium]|nr:hypothetical protein [Bacteroidota bacterium]
MKYPEFFDSIKPIVLYDELAEFLGSAGKGIVEISYLDVVKMAGHSCAVVAGAYLMAQKGLSALFGEEMPQRGQIKVELRRNADEDNAGVTGSVLSNITGAAYGALGFSGIMQNRFKRRDLLFFGVDMPGDVRFTRLDTGASVSVSYRPGKVVQPRSILMSAIGPEATDESRASFPQRWQEMVRTLFAHADTVVEVLP